MDWCHWLISCLCIPLIPLAQHLTPFPHITCASCPPCPCPSKLGRPTRVPCCWQPQNQATDTPTWFAITLYLSLLLFPTHHFFQGPSGCFNFVSCFHPWNHPLDLTIEFTFSCFKSWTLFLKLCLWLFLLRKSSTQSSSSSYKCIRMILAAINKQIADISGS